MQKISLIILFLFTILDLTADELKLWSQSAILIDYDTEQILYEKNKNIKIQPASMTKLLTIYMAYEAINSGLTTKDAKVNITANADFKNLPRDSSLMFIEEGQNVTLHELMLGLAIPSGNDAAIAVAEHLFGSVENYLLELNKMINKLGLSELNFVDSSGYSDDNYITVAQFVEFCMILLKKYPESIEELFSPLDFTYPKYENGTTSIGGIKQFNHNPLIGIFPGSDGLKTGFINASGMNISLTATNGKRRVVAVLAGVKDVNRKIAENKRFYDGITILNYGLQNFENINLNELDLSPVEIQDNIFIKPEIPYKREFTHYNNTEINYELKKDISFPLFYGDQLGYAVLNQNGIIYNFPIIAGKNIIN